MKTPIKNEIHVILTRSGELVKVEIMGRHCKGYDVVADRRYFYTTIDAVEYLNKNYSDIMITDETNKKGNAPTPISGRKNRSIKK